MIQPIRRGVIALILFGVIPLPATGQNPTIVLPTYQLPVIALAQPLSGGVVQQDKPVVVFRFAAGEQGDPIDARSFAMSVDGQDRTSLFQMTVAEAWGPLIPAAETINLGRHEIAARICSARGACNTTTASVTIAATGPTSGTPASKTQKKKTQILDALLGALRTLLKS
jgi:hypothetical protein